jgi:hypothetical protein
MTGILLMRPQWLLSKRHGPGAERRVEDDPHDTAILAHAMRSRDNRNIRTGEPCTINLGAGPSSPNLAQPPSDERYGRSG